MKRFNVHEYVSKIWIDTDEPAKKALTRDFDDVKALPNLYSEELSAENSAQLKK
jgi:hypothetical protein